MGFLNVLRVWLAANPYNVTAQQLGLNGSTTVSGGITQIVTLLVTLIGMLAVVFIIVGGLQMALSAGNPKRFAQGRETVLYACVGLIIAIAAFAIVRFVANSVVPGGLPSPTATPTPR